MQIKGRTSSPSWWGIILAASGVTVTIALGFWQLGRAQEKQALQSRIEDHAKGAPITLSRDPVNPSDVILRPVEVRGQYVSRHTVYLDNRVYHKQAGYYVLMPLRIENTDKFVLINRGWIATGADRRNAPAVKTPEGAVTVRGMATPFSERYMELSSKIAEGNIWQNIVLERYRQATQLDVHPIIVQQLSALDDGLVRDWPPVDLKRNTHLAYAVQWFAFAAAILVYYVVVNVRSRTAT